MNDRVEENGGAQRLKLSIVVPAFNEEAYLGATLDSLRIAAEALRSRTGAEVETIVVDNNSRDRTASIRPPAAGGADRRSAFPCLRDHLSRGRCALAVKMQSRRDADSPDGALARERRCSHRHRPAQRGERA